MSNYALFTSEIWNISISDMNMQSIQNNTVLIVQVMNRVNPWNMHFFLSTGKFELVSNS